MGSLVEIEKACQSFHVGFWMKRIRVLHDVSLEIPVGSVLGLLGANGAGKTTLINLIVGLRTPTSGRVRVGGIDANRPEARLRLGYLPERPYFYDFLTGEGFLSYISQLLDMPRAWALSRIKLALHLVGLSHAGKVELRRYSKGMLQRIGIAQAVLHDPELLILDEPMSGLDPIGRKEIRELVKDLAKDGKTILMSSHIISDVEALCDRVAVIQNGKLIGNRKIGDFLSQGPIKTEVAFKVKKPSENQLLAHATPIPDGWLLTLASQNEVNELLRAILDSGGTVLWVSPQRPTLESVFLDPKKLGSK